MTSKLFSSLALVGTACLGLSLNALAHDDTPGSLLVYPTYDNLRGAITLITVTNTNPDSISGTVRVEYVYINGSDCHETNKTRTLTPNDTITVETRADNPNSTKGYVYVFAKANSGPNTGKAIKFDWLVGLEEVFDGAQADYFQIRPYSFKAGAALAEGALTGLDPVGPAGPNGLRDFDNLEYEAAPNQLISPRFLGQFAAGGQQGTTDLVLINLTGGELFTALVRFLVYNDQEDEFSADYSFKCWIRVPLVVINAVFTNTFLLSTQNVGNNESVLGVYETGWWRLDGLSASIATGGPVTLPDPAILAMQIDRGVVGIGSAFLPYSIGTQTNGKLLAHSVDGN